MAETLLGSKIGHFRVVDKIATGGMGEVYAGFDETLERKVAIKGIRPEYHLDGEAKGRFLREARVLSQLGHPNICQIYDYIEGGQSDFIIMELIEGRNLKQAMMKGLEIRIQMRIAEQVAAVLVAAHEKGVIHRDLKPDNVMLTEGDEVKVLDFGLSRQMSDDVTEGLPGVPPPGPAALPDAVPQGDATLGVAKGSGSSPGSGSQSGLTTVGAIMGTLGYMSPEQARGEVAMAASDMYSFGLLLQELFTGKPPFETGLDAVARLEKARKGETVPVGGVDPDLAALINRLKSFAPGARPSAEDTVQRLAWIREKPLRRRKKILSSAAAAALVLFSVAMTIQSVRATKAEKRAREEAETAKQVSGFLVNLFKVSDPSEARGKTVTAREILDKGAKKIDTELKDQPLVQARLMNSMGVVYRGLGLYAEAEPLLQSALATREKSLPPDHCDVAESLHSLAALYLNQGKYVEAEALVKRALSIREKALGPDHPDVAITVNFLGVLYLNQGRYTEAEPLYKRALAIQEKRLGPDHPDVAASLNNLAILYWYQGRFAEAAPLYKRALAIWEKALGPDHPNVATCLNSLAAICWQQGKYVEADPLVKRALAIEEKVLGPDHPNLAISLTNMAAGYANQGKFAQAEPLYQWALRIRERALGPDHPEVANSLNYLSIPYMSRGKYAEAEPLNRRALTIQEKALGPGHPAVATTLDYQAALYLAQGRYAEVETIMKRALSIQEKTLGPDHPDVAASLNNLASLYYAQGRYAQAQPLYTRCLTICEKASGARSKETSGALRALAACELEEKKFDDALDHSLRGVEIGREVAAKLPEDREIRFFLGSVLVLKGQIEAAMGKGPEGQSSWKEAVSILQPIAKDAQGVGDQDICAQALLCIGRSEEARPIVKKLRELRYKNPDLDALCREKGLKP